MKTEEKNEVIARFMGFVPKKFNPHAVNTIWCVDGLPCGELKFHSSWDWLIPVVEKTYVISKEMQNKFPEEKDLDDGTGWRAWSYRNVHLTTNIQAVYDEVIEFIEFYNNQKP